MMGEKQDSKSLGSQNGDSMSSEPARKKQKLDPSPTFKDADVLVTFLVGDGEKPATFFVHKEIACRASPVFDAAFKDTTFKEGQTQTYSITDISPQAFRMLVQWMYREKLTLLKDSRDKDGDQYRKNDTDHEHFTLPELWLLGDRFLIPKVQNLAMNAIHESVVETNRISTKTYEHIYENTAPASALRRYIVELTAYCVDPESLNIEKDGCYYPEEMLRDIAVFAMKCMGKARTNKLPTGLDLQPYLVPEEESQGM